MLTRQLTDKLHTKYSEFLPPLLFEVLCFLSFSGFAQWLLKLQDTKLKVELKDTHLFFVFWGGLNISLRRGLVFVDSSYLLLPGCIHLLLLDGIHG